jgi:hypothetical protein
LAEAIDLDFPSNSFSSIIHHHVEENLWSISPTFCAYILKPKEVQALNVSTKKLHAKLLYKKVARKMLVKLTLFPLEVSN